ncbi:MAG: hypothetical protein JOZ07_00185, partial [Solirubrobacterales bacterium]|nr:hypothetical protein [Solirubrobacterales bacterium]
PVAVPPPAAVPPATALAVARPGGDAPPRLSLIPQPLHLRPGDVVRIRSLDEIVETLDERGCLDGLPFMPEMARHCGRVMIVDKRADKTCDSSYEARRLEQTVQLTAARCSGAAHGGCQAACLLYFKEAWLARVIEGRLPDARLATDDGRVPDARLAPDDDGEDPGPPTTVEGRRPDVFPGKRALDRLTAASVSCRRTDGQLVFRCQATELRRAGALLPRTDLRQYPRDVRNWGLLSVARAGAIDAFNLLQRVNRRWVPAHPLIRDGLPYPFVQGRLAPGQTPSVALGLRPGEWVRVRSPQEIAATLDDANRNRGLAFDPEMARHCGRVARVRSRVTRLVDERDGTLNEITSDCITLEGVVHRAELHRLCARSTYPMWREVWLERMTPAALHHVRAAALRSTDGAAL